MSKIETAIVSLEGAKMRSTIKKTLRSLGFLSFNIHMVRGGAEGVRKCEETDEMALLILDLRNGADKVLRILEANKKNHQLYHKPAILLSEENSKDIKSLAKEFDILKVLVSENQERLTTSIRQILFDLNNPDEQLSQKRQMEEFRQKNNWNSAAVICQKYYTLHPESEDWAYHVILNHLKLRRNKEAVEIIKFFSKTKDPRILDLMASVYMKKGSYIKAQKCLNIAVKVSPLNITRLLALGNILLNVGRWDDALKTFERILSFAKFSREGRLGKGAALSLLGDIEEAKEVLKNAANIKELAAVFNAAGVIAMRYENYINAERLYETSSEYLIKYPYFRCRVLYNLGLLNVKNEMSERALANFKRAKKMDSHFAPAKENYDFLIGRQDEALNLEGIKLPHKSEVTIGVESNLRGSKWVDFSSIEVDDQEKAS